ncbi:5'-deoxynucleotidase NDAI_0F02070 [Naumovozyma dairenensis CBS 421]|uniref:5'-deoxynucleotidase n=1 Tax=Naumovozyma dairenensis (strain ATCC 10597 / BCRC 20456 / CBS 421 / NBRC 0211 / NRRL Y-12639) TaxID=1071378 RepID=G0WCL4_NAUDC|nr:hypothetical protein NDAI_0F02070 [Naumovozyma dairenensis CBS 421]CCD25525.1 hypothetical protein NDAI_0F02070 [Naumovozyma dairenensis CBS 421]
MTITQKENNNNTIWDPKDHIPDAVTDFLLSAFSTANKNSPLPFFTLVQQLKLQKRTGWLDFQIIPCESIADHMYRMSLMTMIIKDPLVNRDRCVKIALIHDIAESLVGDITPIDPFVNKVEKHRRELATIEHLCKELISPYNEKAGNEIMEYWLEYEEVRTLEGRYVKDIDKFEMLLQCFEFEKQYNGEKNLQEFFTAVDLIKTEEVKSWTDDLVKQRNQFFANVSKRS